MYKDEINCTKKCDTCFRKVQEWEGLPAFRWKNQIVFDFENILKGLLPNPDNLRGCSLNEKLFRFCHYSFSQAILMSFFSISSRGTDQTQPFLLNSNSWEGASSSPIYIATCPNANSFFKQLISICLTL